MFYDEVSLGDWLRAIFAINGGLAFGLTLAITIVRVIFTEMPLLSERQWIPHEQRWRRRRGVINFALLVFSLIMVPGVIISAILIIKTIYQSAQLFRAYHHWADPVGVAGLIAAVVVGAGVFIWRRASRAGLSPIGKVRQAVASRRTDQSDPADPPQPQAQPYQEPYGQHGYSEQIVGDKDTWTYGWNGREQ